MPKPDLKWMRCTARILRMVSELHRMGYQRLRVMPYEGPTSYRVWIAPAQAFSKVNGAVAGNHEAEHACYFAPTEDGYFGWDDAKGDDARALAEKFLQRFSRLCELGEGSDWAYAGWLADLLAALERHPDRLPWIDGTDFTDIDPESMTHLPLRRMAEGGSKVAADIAFPLPPAPV